MPPVLSIGGIFCNILPFGSHLAPYPSPLESVALSYTPEGNPLPPILVSHPPGPVALPLSQPSPFNNLSRGSEIRGHWQHSSSSSQCQSEPSLSEPPHSYNKPPKTGLSHWPVGGDPMYTHSLPSHSERGTPNTQPRINKDPYALILWASSLSFGMRGG